MKALLASLLLSVTLLVGCAGGTSDDMSGGSGFFLGPSDAKPASWVWLEKNCWWVEMEFISGNYTLTLKYETPNNPVGSRSIRLEGNSYAGVLRKGVEKVKQDK